MFDKTQTIVVNISSNGLFILLSSGFCGFANVETLNDLCGHSFNGMKKVIGCYNSWCNSDSALLKQSFREVFLVISHTEDNKLLHSSFSQRSPVLCLSGTAG